MSDKEAVKGSHGAVAAEEVLPEELPAALYVYKGVLSAKAVEERLDRLAGDR